MQKHQVWKHICEASQLQTWMVSVHELLFGLAKQAPICLEFLN